MEERLISFPWSAIIAAAAAVLGTVVGQLLQMFSQNQQLELQKNRDRENRKLDKLEELLALLIRAKTDFRSSFVKYLTLKKYLSEESKLDKPPIGPDIDLLSEIDALTSIYVPELSANVTRMNENYMELLNLISTAFDKIKSGEDSEAKLSNDAKKIAEQGFQILSKFQKAVIAHIHTQNLVA